MKTVVIGGTGHIGGNLVSMLLEDGHEVTVISSGRTLSHTPATLVRMNYSEMFGSGQFASLLADRRPDTVIDILQGNTSGVFDACKTAGVGHLIVCGSVWMFGRARIVPTPETTQAECEFEGYKQRYAAMLEAQDRAKREGFAFTAIMPPNICGPGKIPLDCDGGRSIEAHRAHQRGDRVVLPFPGTNLIGPCDAEDVARAFFLAVNNRDAAAGQIFNVGSAYALTATEFVRAYGEIYGSEIPIEYVSPEKYITEISPDPGASFHFMAHMCPDLTKVSTLLGYRPAYTPEQTMERAVEWMYGEGMLEKREVTA